MFLFHSHARRPVFSRIALTMLAALAFTPAHAQPAPPAPVDAPAQMTPAQKAKLAPRRPTRQVVGSPLPIVTDGYRPTLTPRERASGMPDPVGTLPVHPTPAGTTSAPLAPSPIPVTACAAGGCTGADGVHYNTGGSGVTVDPAGRTCHRVGTTVQCF
jgi:hypothetical protein